MVGGDVDQQVRLVVLGWNKVGKSAMTVRFLTRRFISEYAGGIDSAYVHTFNIQGRSIDMKIIDKGEKRDSTDLIRWGEGFILVYSIVNRRSFEELLSLRTLINSMKEQLNHKKVPVVLVGNKLDLRRQREVSLEEAKHLANELDCAYFEVSAADQIEPIMDIFHYTAIKVLDAKDKTLIADTCAVKLTRASSTPESVKKLFGRRKLHRRRAGRDRTKTL